MSTSLSEIGYTAFKAAPWTGNPRSGPEDFPLTTLKQQSRRSRDR
jgi:hypothetical protein